MPYQSFELDMNKPFAVKVAKLVHNANGVLYQADNLKSVADELTAGGTDTGAAEYLARFGLPDATAGAALYAMLQSVIAGSVLKATIVEFDQGLL